MLYLSASLLVSVDCRPGASANSRSRLMAKTRYCKRGRVPRLAQSCSTTLIQRVMYDWTTYRPEARAQPDDSVDPVALPIGHEDCLCDRIGKGSLAFDKHLSSFSFFSCCSIHHLFCSLQQLQNFFAPLSSSTRRVFI